MAHDVLDPEPAGTKALIARFDWASTPLGPRTSWPGVLQTTVDIMLNSPLPMVTLWGRDGILVYNDGYAEICGARHPGVLGAKALDAWPEVANLNQRVLDTCFAGHSLTLRDEHLVLLRNGFIEDIWLDVDYGPIHDADGEVAGVLAVVSDVTTRVLSEWRRREAEHQLALTIEAADLGTFDYDLRSQTCFYSDRMKAMFGLSADATVTRAQLQQYVHPEDWPRHLESYERAVDPAIRARLASDIRTIGAEDGVMRWVSVSGRGYFDPHGEPLRLAGVAIEVTERKRAELRHAWLVELGDRLRAAQTTADIARVSAELMGRAIGCTRAGYAHIRGDVAFVEADWTNGEQVSLAGPRLFKALGEEYYGPLLAGRPMIVEDVDTHPATQFNREAFRRINMCAVLNIPLLEDGRLVASVYVHQDKPRRWREDEIKLVQDVADRTWEAYGRAYAAQALQKLNASLEQEVALRTAQRDRIWRLSSDVMVVADAARGVIQSVNPAWSTVFGWNESELIDRPFLDCVHPDDQTTVADMLRDITTAQTTIKFECRCRRRDGAYLWISWRAVPDAGALHAVGRDITAEREQAEALKAAEEALRQAQKMEAVGQLTGGIAHDFNNLLQGIVGSLDLVEKRQAEGRGADVAKFVAAARASANRAVALTHRLLAFSRRQPLDPRPVQANPLVASMEELLRRTMGERIELALVLADDLWPTLCDPNQLESAILNLAINARDAMPDGGRLVLETVNTELDASYAARAPEVKPGKYICVSVTDTGTGMPASVIEQAFEPFFTTKPLGQGTGLGLSMIYGFAKQSEGHARIYSEVGHGTTVKLYLPRFSGALEAETQVPAAPGAQPAPLHATVLVVEDEEVVRSLVLEVIDELGLTPLEAKDGPAGLRILQSRQKIDLLITDIGLPGLNGRQIADAARLVRPDLKILFMTGYAENAAMANGFLEPGMAMITKPFPIQALMEKIREIVEA